MKRIIVFLLFSTISLLLCITIRTYADTTTSNSVSLTVPVRPGNYTSETSLITPIKTNYTQDTEITYQVTYTSHISTSEPITLTAYWDDGSVSGVPVTLVSYVTGSATNAYNGTTPVVDLTNKKITWTISSYPGNTENTVTFALKTTSNYTGSSTVTFPVSSKITASGVTTDPKTINTSYLYAAPSSNPTPTPTVTPDQTTPTPSPIQKNPTFEGITIDSISSSEARFRIRLSQSTAVTMYAGTNEKNLSRQTTSGANTTHVFILGDLSPNTTYFAKFVTAGQSVSSDIFSFTTAKVNVSRPTFNPTSLIFTSNKIIISTPDSTSEKNAESSQQTAIIPPNTTYEIRLMLDLPEATKRVRVVLRKQSAVSVVSHAFSAPPEAFSPVLGISTNTKTGQEDQVLELTQVEKGVYIGKIQARPATGTYDVYLHIATTFGASIEQKIATIQVVDPLLILDKTTKTPIDGARVFISIYNSTTKRFEELSPDFFQIQNPTFSNEHGQASLVLPRGTYRVHVSMLNYKDTDITFKIGVDEENYPTIYLTPEKATLLLSIKSFLINASDMTSITVQTYIASLKLTPKTFQTRSLLTLIFLCIITLVAFYGRTHLAPWRFPGYLYEHIRHHVYPPHTAYSGYVVYEGHALPGVRVIVTHPTTHHVIKQGITDKKGRFFITLPQDNVYALSFIKDGFDEEIILTTENRQTIVLSSQSETKHLRDTGMRILVHFLSFFFECALVTSLLFEALFLTRFQYAITLPFLFISISNLLIWIFYVKQK